MPCPECGGAIQMVNPTLDGDYSSAICIGEYIAIRNVKLLTVTTSYGEPCGWSKGKMESEGERMIKENHGQAHETTTTLSEPLFLIHYR